MNELTGKEQFYIFGHRGKSTATIDDVSEVLGVNGKVDKLEVHRFLNSNEIVSWFGKQPDLNELKAGIHFVNADEAGVKNAPASGIYKVTQFDISNYVLQEAERYSTGERYSRAKVGTIWGGWNQTGGKEVTPPSDLPIGKEGQMLVYRSGAWKATSLFEIAASLHINHDSHRDLDVPIVRVDPNDKTKVMAEDLSNLYWTSLTSNVEVTFVKYSDSWGVTFCMLVRSNSASPIKFNMVGIGYPSLSSQINASNGFNYDLTANPTPLNFTPYSTKISQATYYEDNAVFHTGTFTIMDGDDKTFIDFKFSKAYGEKKMYMKLRTRMDFQPYYEPPDPELP